MTPDTTTQTRSAAITLDREGGPALTVSVRLPAAPGVVADILPGLHAVADALQDELRRDLAATGRSLACARGCDACCRHLVLLGEPEALGLLRTLRALPEPRGSAVQERFRAGLERLESAGLLPELYAACTRNPGNADRLAALQAAYWELQLPCPFLEDHACCIYAGRPLACRQHAMTSAPEACRAPFAAGSGLGRARTRLDLAGAAAAFDGMLAHQSRVLPLIFCLLRETHLALRPYPVQEPEAMLLRLLDFAAGHYARKTKHP